MFFYESIQKLTYQSEQETNKREKKMEKWT